MESYMGELVRENARIAREMRGVASLNVPRVDEKGWRMRRLALLRAEHLNCLRLFKEVETTANTVMVEETQKNALIVLPSDKTKENTQPMLEENVIENKRLRTEDAVISVDPKVLKNRMSVVSSTLGGDGRHMHGEPYVPPPTWKMSKVLVGHRGWVWCAAVDPSNSWFATGGGDGVVKVWDLTTGALKLNLTGHKEGVRSVSLSTLSPYMFSGGDDHSVKCWDLERNEIIRDFHGHKGSVHCVSAHPSLDIIMSGGRDKTVRLWDVRTRSCVHLLLGHTDSVMSLETQQADPQVVSGGSDGMIYLWDIAAGRAFTRLTRHRKPVRGLAFTRQGTLVSCGADNIRVWSLPTGDFLFNASTSPVDVNVGNEGLSTTTSAYRWSCCAFSPRNVLVVGSQEGKLAFYDWGQTRRSPYQLAKTVSLPGTLPGEGGINHVVFDASGSRMITAESDKSVKVWRTKE